MIFFDPMESFVDSNFWIALTELKLNVLKLNDQEIAIFGNYTRGKRITQKLYPSRLMIKNMEKEDIQGTLVNTNTLNEFKDLDKNAFVDKIGREIYDKIQSLQILEDPNFLAKFGLLTFCDLKKYKYYYWFCFPAIVPKDPIIEESITSLADLEPAEGEAIFNLNPPSDLKFFLIVKSKINPASYEIKHLKEYKFFDMATTMFGYLDPSCQPKNPGWVLRNYLCLIQKLTSSQSIKIIGFRETLSDSIVTAIKIPIDAFSTVTYLGWEKGVSGNPSPRLVNLAPLMDPKALADSAVDLNLKLMRWRILPSLDLDSIQKTKCLLLGAGTLGCYVARMLMAWGVRSITLVDNGKVSFSNPVRQPLFVFEDCLEGGKPKAEAAADQLRKVFPGVDAKGVELSIPMPGHFVDSQKAVEERIEKLKGLISEHDAVFLLTDSRESRWLPTVLCAAAKKIVINTALGFDTFLVMRHGIRDLDNPPEERLGCYFCNDVVAPADSLSDRTLDQQCTVTRPGLSGIASALAVELLSSILNHPDGPKAKADLKDSDAKSTLGLVPHQIRGFLAQFSNMLLVGHGYDKCTACSDAILQAYRKEGNEFLIQGLKDPAILERIAGLEKMKQDVQDQQDDFDWDDEGDDDL